jgi:predicted metalloprotease with PDZ domain
MMRPVPALVFLALAVAPLTAAAQTRMTDPISYTLRFPAPETHYVDVEAVVPTGGQAAIELMMPVWTPGSYLVREYERNVEQVEARGANGKGLAVSKTQKNRWKIETGGAPRITVTYRVYGREMSVRTNWIESRFALLNGAPTFLGLPEKGAMRPHLVTVVLPDAWKTTVTGLAPLAGTPHKYRAESYDELVDSPILAGNPAVHRFDVAGVPHVLANEGEAGVFDGARAAADLARIVAEAEQFWGSLPYDRYAFINVLSEAGGGLEHADSTVLMASRWATGSRKAYVNWLTLAAHEHFHAWNVKRLRPVELGPFDYERENPTTGLWIAEGVTAYYEHVLVRRAGLSTDAELIDGVGSDIRELQTTPGRLVQPVQTASLDAWIKYYRSDENTPNTAISYYTKGAVIGFLLDAKIRKATNGLKSLDDAMRLAYTRYSGAAGFTDAQFRAVVHDVAGKDFGPWWTSVLQTVDELSYDEALDWFGLRFKPVDTPGGPAAATTATPPPAAKAWLGATTKNDGGRLVVTQVRRGTPAHQAGLNVDDEILAIDDFRVRADGLAPRLEQYAPGRAVTLLVARRDELLRLPVTLGREPADTWRLEIRPDATPEQQAHRKAWSGDVVPVATP